MLSFINMGGGRSKRRRSKKRKPSVTPPAVGNGVGASPGSAVHTHAPARPLRRSSSISGTGVRKAPSLKLPKPAEKSPKPHAYAQASTPEEQEEQEEEAVGPFIWSSNRSPEIQLEFNHDSLLNSFPTDLLKFRKGSTGSGSGSSTSLLNDVNENRTRRANMPAPLQIPLASPKRTPVQPTISVPGASKQGANPNLSPMSRISESDADPVSAISGISFARDAFSRTFSLAMNDREEPDNRDARNSLSRTLNSGNQMTRQDSATLPRESNWLEVPRSAASGGRPATSPQSAVPSLGRRKSGPHQRGQISTPPPPTSTPSAQRLDHADQLALHRISRITEAPSPTPSLPSSPEVNRKASPSPSSGQLSQTTAKLGTPVASPAKTKSGGSSPNMSARTPPSSSSKYSSSPLPGEFPMSAPATIDSIEVGHMDLESFLDDFQFVSPVHEEFPADGPFGASASKAQYSLVTSPPSDDLPAVPETARSTVSSTKDKGKAPEHARSGSVSSISLSAHSAKSANASFSIVNVSTESARSEVLVSAGGSSSSRSRDVNLLKAESRSRAGSNATIGSTQSSSNRNKGVSMKVFTAKNTQSDLRPPSRDNRIPITFLPIGERGSTRSSPQHSSPASPIVEKRRPSLPHLNLGSSSNSLSRSPANVPTSPSIRSPDLLDMFVIPNAHVVNSISSMRLRRKRSGSMPNPMRAAQMARPVVPSSQAKDVAEKEDNRTPSTGEHARTPSTGTSAGGHGQTFPETPEMFSPVLSADFPMDAMSLSSMISSPSGTLIRPSRSSVLRASSLSRRLALAQALQPIVVSFPTPTPISEESEGALSPPQTGLKVDGKSAEKPASGSNSPQRLSPSTFATNSPPISPLEPFPSSTPATASSITLPTVQMSSTVKITPPIIQQVPEQKMRSRPPLPFGPRKPSQASLSFASPSSMYARGKFSPPGLSAGSKGSSFSSPGLSTPKFQVTPVRWRGYTLDAAKWTFTSTEMQNIVSRAIRQSCEPSSIRLLPLAVLDGEIPEEVEQLEFRKLDLQTSYKIQVRKRRMLLDCITSLSAADTPALYRLAEELGDVSATCDQITEELLDTCEQLGQINRLKDIHNGSAHAMASRKLNANYLRQAAELQVLRKVVQDLQAERDEGWKQASDLARELDDMNESMEGARSNATSPSSKTPSRRSSHVSLAMKRSSLASKAGLRSSSVRHSHRSSGSSLRVNLSTGVRSTFSSDIIPPVPPLPSLDLALGKDRSNRSSMACLSGIPTSTDAEALEIAQEELLDMLGINVADIKRAGSFPSRPQSVHVTSSRPQSTDLIEAQLQSPLTTISRATQHWRSGSLPTVTRAKSHREVFVHNRDAVLALLNMPPI